MPTYRIAQDAGSIGDADDCWSVYKREDFGIEEVIAIVQTECLAEKLLKMLEPPLSAKPDQLFLYGKHVCNCQWEFVTQGTKEEVEQVIKNTDGEYVSYQTSETELNI